MAGAWGSGRGPVPGSPRSRRTQDALPAALLLTRAPIVSSSLRRCQCCPVPWWEVRGAAERSLGLAPPQCWASSCTWCVWGAGGGQLQAWVWGAGTGPGHHWKNSQVPPLCPGVAKQDHWVGCEEEPTSPGGRPEADVTGLSLSGSLFSRRA